MAETRSALMRRLLVEAVGDCCMTPKWRGHLCSYHKGVEAGIEMTMDALSSFTIRPVSRSREAQDG